MNFLGLANRAGKIASGDTVINKIQRKEAKLVIIATDASDSSKKRLIDKCSFYKVPYVEFFEKEQLGLAIGKSHRSSCAILDLGFSKKLESMIIENSGGEFHE
ncbi:ribosomal L7Ae/L30e/S12e/Gadd45 family protein [Desulfuribacillus stibiiarsenatis]|uniref:L7Ae/L30e/S12e/Gadd45 family ribosomal protein n=1 Tax=Desulfuribacillus stibiiarsenatis TaxID=1390249 RepID=UPI002657FD8F|nr:ribosomal L7Ae/L30e/S12e/Gadd45 family protein [Desulfuribacillus stibiiarsenatis]